MRRPIQSVTVTVAIACAAPVAPAGSPRIVARPDSQQAASAEAQVDQELTLDEAVSRALRLNPTILASVQGVAAAGARHDQAGLYANPELDLEVENFGGEKDLGGFDGAETTITLSQPLLLGGKIARRKGVADADVALATRDLEAVRLDVRAAATMAFYEVAAAQERVRLTKELADLAVSFADTVRARVEAGRVSPVEAIRAGAEVARTRVEVAKAGRALQSAKVDLATTWGSSDPRFDGVVGSLPTSGELPPTAELRRMLTATPDMVRLQDEAARHEKALALEKARGVPDLALSLGPRRFEATGDWAWVGGVSLELPIFDRRQGARRAAAFELERAQRDAAARRTALEARLARLVELLHALAEETRSYEQDIVPASAQALDAMSLGFREGKFGFLEVLDAQRSLFEATVLLLDSRHRYAVAHAELERLLGRHLRADGGAQSGGWDPGQGVQR